MNHVLDTTWFVVEQAESVTINHEYIAEFAKCFNAREKAHWLVVSPFDLSRLTLEEALHFVFILNAISFSYWGDPKWTIAHQGESHDGARGMMLAIGRAIEEGIPLLSFDYCSTISKNDLSYILRGNAEIPLLEERWKILREIGTNMVTKYEGTIDNLLDDARRNAEDLVHVIVHHFPSFTDTSLYKNKEVHFNKRAQLLTADIARLLEENDSKQIEGIDQITACADYKIPQILREQGVLEYAPPLAKKVDENIAIPHHAPEEVEIRASTIWAVELLKEAITKSTPQHISSHEINDWLWLRTQEKRLNEKPYHRTRTIAY